MIEEIQLRAISGKSAHLSARNALQGLKLDVTGRKILNTPYTIWQLLKHINYWQQKWMDRLDGLEIEEDSTWTIGWEDELNATSQEELDLEINYLLDCLNRVKTILKEKHELEVTGNEHYANQHEIIQAMSSHLSYHIGELILLRRIFGAWPPPSGGYVW
ncbi:MAG: DinB family protein [Bacteroidota bacterium]